MRQSAHFPIVALMQRLARPESWLALLLLVTLRTPHWLTWAAGIGLALTCASFLVRSRRFARAVTVLAGITAALGLIALIERTSDALVWGSAALLGLPIALCVGLTARSRRWQALGQTIALLCALCIAASGLAGAWLGAGASVAVFVCLWQRLAHERQARPLGSLGLLTLGMAVSAAIVAGALYTQNAPPSLPAPNGSMGRLSFDTQSLRELGAPGLTVYWLALLALVGRAVYFLRRGRRQTPGSREALVIATLSVLAGQAVDSLLSPSWAGSLLVLPFWLLVGAGMAALSRPDTPAEAALVSPRPSRLALAGATTVLVAAFVGITAQENFSCLHSPHT